MSWSKQTTERSWARLEVWVGSGVGAVKIRASHLTRRSDRRKKSESSATVIKTLTSPSLYETMHHDKMMVLFGFAYIIFSQQPRAEFQVIIQIERPSSFESHTKGCHGCVFRELLHAFDSPKLAVRVL